MPTKYDADARIHNAAWQLFAAVQCASRLIERMKNYPSVVAELKRFGLADEAEQASIKLNGALEFAVFGNAIQKCSYCKGGGQIHIDFEHSQWIRCEACGGTGRNL